MTEFTAMARRGIARFDTFAEGQDAFDRQRATATVLSMANAAVPDLLFVSGVVDRDDSNRLYFTAVGKDVSAKGSYTPENQAQVAVYSNRDIKSIEINDAVNTESDVLDYQGTGLLEYVLRFTWGDVVVQRQTGGADERTEWLSHFTRVLADNRPAATDE